LNDVGMPALRELFGLSRDDIWRQLAAKMGANYIEGSFWKSPKVQASHGEWVITLEGVTVGRSNCTSLMTFYVNPDGFRFGINRKGLFSDVEKWLGLLTEVEVGYPDFDRDFIINGNDKAKLRRLFGNARIRELISAQPEIHFSVREAPGFFMRDIFSPKLPENVDILQFLVAGTIQDEGRLRLLFDLFAETLDELCRMGSAYKGQ
jgi:hypothetical protein